MAKKNDNDVNNASHMSKETQQRKSKPSSKKNISKKTLREEYVESGLSKSDFFKAKFDRNDRRRTEKHHKKANTENPASKKKNHKNTESHTKFSNTIDTRKSSHRGRETKIYKTLRKDLIIPVRVLDILTDDHNEQLSALAEYQGVAGPERQILIERLPDHIDVNNTVAVKLIAHKKKLWIAQFIRLIRNDTIQMGVYNASTRLVSSIHRKKNFTPLPLERDDQHDNLSDQTVIIFKEQHGRALFQEEVGLISSSRSFSKIAAFNSGVWKVITREEEDFCKNFDIPSLKDSKGKMRDDLRDLDLVTIDGADAKDFDDAVWAEPDLDPRNPGGYRIIVAIADVSYYVREGDLLDIKARDRGNSVYFPDYVLPMLPERLSNDLCSLRPHVDRACVVADMIISANGKLKNTHFKRALMRSKARLTYEEVEKALHGKINQNVEPVFESTIKPLQEAYRVLRQARQERGSLDIHSVEHKILFDNDHRVKDVVVRQELMAHQIIEEMMILANIAVAKALKNRDYPCMYRIHPAPDGSKVQNLKIFAKALELPTIKPDRPTPHDFNRILAAVKGSPYESLMNDLILRCQSQAQYSPQNQGHYGLGLQDYCHFTSPIRRYADLIIHRLLIDLFDLGEGGHKYTSIDGAADHISNTERQAVSAEREANERFLADYLSQHVGDMFDAVIVGVSQNGLFIEITDVYAEAFVPKRLLFDLTNRGSSYFDAALHVLRVGHLSFQLGMAIKVKLIEANAITCQVTAQVVIHEEKKKHTKKETSSKKTKKPSQKIEKNPSKKEKYKKKH